jgi:CRP/FNR family transcriptional regulator, cyclic AMP receptor protein
MSLFTQDAKVEALRRAPLFAGLSTKELEQLARHSEDVEVPAGKVLAREGDIGHEFFVVLEGEAEFTRHGEPIDMPQPGAFFGEISLLEHTRRMATVTAATPLRFFVLTEREFRALVDENPEIELKVLRAAAKRLAVLAEREPTLL